MKLSIEDMEKLTTYADKLAEGDEARAGRMLLSCAAILFAGDDTAFLEEAWEAHQVTRDIVVKVRPKRAN